MINFLLPALSVVLTLGGILLTSVVVFVLFRRSAGAKPLKGGVTGTAEVVSVSMPYTHGNTLMTNCRMDLVITGPGILATAVEFDGIIQVRNRPSVGARLPASIDPANPRNFVILWAQIPDKRVVAHQRAEDIATTLRERQGKTLARGLVIGFTEYQKPPQPDPSMTSCMIRMQIFADGESPVEVEGRRVIPRIAVPYFEGSESVVAVWFDPSSPKTFVLDVAEPPPTIKMGRASGPGSRDWLVSNGRDTTVTILGFAVFKGVQNYAGDACYVVHMLVASQKPAVDVTNLQPITAAQATMLKVGATLPARVGSTPDRVVLMLP